MPDGMVFVFDAKGSRYVLASANMRQVMAVFCCTFGRGALGGGVISLPFWCMFGRAALSGGVIN